jgi:Protein of unknown function (DUF1761)
MSFSLLGDLNWLAVIVAALAYFVVGAAWYAPAIFGNVWTKAGGLEMQPDERPNPVVFITPLIGSILAAIALGMIAEASATDTIGEGVVLGLVTGIGFAIGISFVTAQFEANKPNRMVWGAVNGGYHLVGTIVAAIVIAAWQ